MPERSRQQLVREAARLVGREELALRLKVTPALVDKWINGRARMPDAKLAILVRILETLARRK
jgi:DNA-binding transcriptional regulator YdaS (Cro superfamily)